MTKIVFDDLNPVKVFLNRANEITIIESHFDCDAGGAPMISLSIEEFESLIERGHEFLAQAKAEIECQELGED